MEYAWRNLQPLTLWLRRLLYLGVVIDLFALASDIYQGGVFRQSIAQGIAAAEAGKTADLAGAWASAFVSYPLACLGLVTTILAAVWIYRAATNLRVLGAQAMAIEPGWAVGWYFIPIANCWKPYQAMKEIWQASARPQQWQGLAAPPLLRMWWGLWLLNFFIPCIVVIGASMTARHGSTTESWQLNHAAQMVGSLIDMPLSLVFAALVGKIWRMQASHAASPSSPMPVAGVPGTTG
jgi:hypothetical protein